MLGQTAPCGNGCHLLLDEDSSTIGMRDACAPVLVTTHVWWTLMERMSAFNPFQDSSRSVAALLAKVCFCCDGA
jgi:hypothetical protein